MNREGNHGGHLARQRQDLLRCAGSEQSAADCIAFVFAARSAITWRDMSDDMIKSARRESGVIQINYERSFIDQAYKDASEKLPVGWYAQFDQFKKECGDDRNALGEDADCRNKPFAEGRLRT